MLARHYALHAGQARLVMPGLPCTVHHILACIVHPCLQTSTEVPPANPVLQCTGQPLSDKVASYMHELTALILAAGDQVSNRSKGPCLTCELCTPGCDPYWGLSALPACCSSVIIDMFVTLFTVCVLAEPSSLHGLDAARDCHGTRGGVQSRGCTADLPCHRSPPHVRGTGHFSCADVPNESVSPLAACQCTKEGAVNVWLELVGSSK